MDGAIASTSLAGGVSSAVFLLLFAVGVAVRIGRFLTGRVSLLKGSERDRVSGRGPAADVPTPRRRRRKSDDDPALPLGR